MDNQGITTLQLRLTGRGTATGVAPTQHSSLRRIALQAQIQMVLAGSPK